MTTRHRGFSLIEVLMAVLILSLGLLALGVVFPVVVGQQRAGINAQLGATAGQSAKALLQGERLGANEVRRLRIVPNNSGNAPQGTYRLRYDGEQTTPIDVAATAGQIQAALEALPTIRSGNVEVRGRDGEFTVEFVGQLGGIDLPPQGQNGRQITVVDADTQNCTVENPSAAAAVVSNGVLSIDREFWYTWAKFGADFTNAQIQDQPGDPFVQGLVPPLGAWMVPVVDGAGTTYLGSFEVRIDPSRGTYNRLGQLFVADRLFPGDASYLSDPQLVWDIAVRRLGRGSTTLQVAIFVRKLDPRIRPGTDPATRRPYSVAESILDPSGRVGLAGELRLPVTVTVDGAPRLDGVFDVQGATAVYSPPVVMGASFPSVAGPGGAPRRDVLQLIEGRDTDIATWGGNHQPTFPVVLAEAMRPGQTLVDNLGNVYTVREILDASQGLVAITPPVPSDVTPEDLAQTDYQRADNTLASTIRQVVFTPQPPVSVVIFTVNP